MQICCSATRLTYFIITTYIVVTFTSQIRYSDIVSQWIRKMTLLHYDVLIRRYLSINCLWGGIFSWLTCKVWFLLLHQFISVFEEIYICISKVYTTIDINQNNVDFVTPLGFFKTLTLNWKYSDHGPHKPQSLSKC